MERPKVVILAQRREERPLAYGTAIKQIRALWEKGQVTWTRHAEDRLKQRKLDTVDVERIIKRGRVTEHSHPMNNWRYKVVGLCADNEPGACLVEIEGNLIIVTVIV